MTKKEIIRGTLLGIVLLGAIGYILIKRSQLDRFGRYTIGITTGQDGKFVKYKFYVDGKEYNADNERLKYSPRIRDGRYLVKFLPSDLSMSEIFWESPVPNHIKGAPPDGWEKRPW